MVSIRPVDLMAIEKKAYLCFALARSQKKEEEKIRISPNSQWSLFVINFDACLWVFSSTFFFFLLSFS